MSAVPTPTVKSASFIFRLPEFSMVPAPTFTSIWPALKSPSSSMVPAPIWSFIFWKLKFSGQKISTERFLTFWLLAILRLPLSLLILTRLWSLPVTFTWTLSSFHVFKTSFSYLRSQERSDTAEASYTFVYAELSALPTRTPFSVTALSAAAWKSSSSSSISSSESSTSQLSSWSSTRSTCVIPWSSTLTSPMVAPMAAPPAVSPKPAAPNTAARIRITFRKRFILFPPFFHSGDYCRIL